MRYAQTNDVDVKDDYMLLVIVLYALFGFSFTLGKLTLFYSQPIFIVGVRMIIGGLGLITYIYWRHRFQCYPSSDDSKYYLQLILLGILVPYCLRSWALQFISTGKSALIFNLAPFFAAFFSYLFMRERLTWLKFFGLFIGFSGMIPVLLTSSFEEDYVGGLWFFSWPELATIGAVASLSYSMIIMQKLVKHRGCPPYLANATAMLIGGILAFNISMVFENNWIKQQPLMFIGLLGLQILISNFICANLQANLLKHYSTTFMSFASFLSPLCAAFYGWLFFNEAITWHYFASFLIVLIGLGLYYYDDIYKHRLKKSSVGMYDQV